MATIRRNRLPEMLIKPPPSTEKEPPVRESGTCCCALFSCTPYPIKAEFFPPPGRQIMDSPMSLKTRDNLDTKRR